MQTSVINADCPQRKEGLEVHTVSDQVVIYESGSDTVHYLNPTAAVVLELAMAVALRPISSGLCKRRMDSPLRRLAK